MDIKNKKELAARTFGVGKDRVYFDPLKLEEIKKAITKEDIRNLKKENIIKIKPKKGISRGRARKRDLQRKKGRRRGHGSRKGTKNARLNQKNMWIRRIRALRSVLKEMRDKKEIDTKTYRKLYLMAKGNTFKSVKALKEYINTIKAK
ncbi:MAG: 50S ribosomal protein L19e [Candidatus Altarchaeaceae archaeon]